MHRLLILSDLHIEFSNFSIPAIENEDNIDVILAGDIGVVSKESSYANFLIDVSKRFKTVIYVCGNHEHYLGKFPTTINKLKKFVEDQNLNNVYVLEKETKVIDGVAFIGATLWTDMDKNDPLTMFNAERVMRDYVRIRTGPEAMPWRQKLAPIDTMADHRMAKEFIFPEITKQKEAGNKTVVVTHHLPSFMSIADELKCDNLNGAYASELGNDIADLEPDLWVHGHTHYSFDYMINKTRIVCNPRGYVTDDPSDKNADFIDDLIIEI